MIAMKTVVSGVALVAALALMGCEKKPAETTPAPAPEPAQAPATPTAASDDAKCPTFSIASEIGKPSAGKVTFTLSPTRDGLTYNWSTAAGSIVSGQGTPTIIVEDPTPGDVVTVTTEVGGLDASCSDTGKYASTTATMP